jgi:hypothetical protein
MCVCVGLFFSCWVCERRHTSQIFSRPPQTISRERTHIWRSISHHIYIYIYIYTSIYIYILYMWMRREYLTPQQSAFTFGADKCQPIVTRVGIMTFGWLQTSPPPSQYMVWYFDPNVQVIWAEDELQRQRETPSLRALQLAAFLNPVITYCSLRDRLWQGCTALLCQSRCG